MVRVTARLLRRVPEYWKRYSDRCKNLRVAPPRYVYLRGWVGEDRRHHWLETSSPVYSEIAQMMNLKQDRDMVEKELLEPIKEWTIHVGDRVEVLVGRDKGKQGIVRKIIYERNWVFVEGLNVQYSPSLVEDGPINIEEMPLNVTSEIALVDPVTEKAATNVEWRYSEKGERVRVVFPSEVILNPMSSAEVLADGVEPQVYIEDPSKDTTEALLDEPTYKPSLKTFQQDIMETMGIKEERVRGKTYWY